MFKTNLFIDRLYIYLIYIYIYIKYMYIYCTVFCILLIYFTLDKNIKFSIFKHSISLINHTIAESQR